MPFIISQGDILRDSGHYNGNDIANDLWHRIGTLEASHIMSLLNGLRHIMRENGKKAIDIIQLDLLGYRTTNSYIEFHANVLYGDANTEDVTVHIDFI